MSEPQAYLDGRFLPAREATIPIYDAGFVLGATVTEQLRTFGGRLFRLQEHLDRLWHSLELVDIRPAESRDELARIADALVERNFPLIAPESDLGLAIFVTPGPYRAIGGPAAGPLVGMHTFPLAFGLWAPAYRQGQALVTTHVQQVPHACWPPEVKCRSRMHYYLGDREAAQIEPGARALFLDADGHVTETSTANLLLCERDHGLVAPPRGTVLPGVSLHAAIELAKQLGLPFRERPLLPVDVSAADEVMLTSTPFCLLPVTRFNGQQIGGGGPGAVFQQLLEAWNRQAGFDIAAQAEQCASP